MLGCDFCKVIFAVCLSRGWNHLKTTQALVDVWQASETSHNKAAWATFNSIICMNCYLMCTAIVWWWKCVLPWSQLFWDPVIIKLSAISNLPINNVSAMTASAPEPAHSDQFTLMIVDQYRDQEKCSKVNLYILQNSWDSLQWYNTALQR